MTHWTEHESLRTACASAKNWAGQFPTFQDFWDACNRPDWLLWAVDHGVITNVPPEFDAAYAEAGRVYAAAHAEALQVYNVACAEARRVLIAACDEAGRVFCTAIRAALPKPVPVWEREKGERP